MKDVIVIGAGFSGATAARRAAEAGYAVKVYEARPHIGGNAYDYRDDSGILIHAYGPHIYHTNSAAAHAFLSRFTEWIPYEHRVLGSIDGKLVPIPFNLTSLKALFPAKEAEHIEKALLREYGGNTKVPVFTLKNHADTTVRHFGEYVYEKVFYNYTVKQWGDKPENLNPEAMKRVPVYIGTDDRYFTDKYQFMPKEGYTALFRNLLDYKNIEVICNADGLEPLDTERGTFDGLRLDGGGGTIVYTGCIDRLFGYEFGALPYRALRFEFECVNKKSYQPAAVVNYPNDFDYTRISEFTKFTCPPAESTVIVREYPEAHVPEVSAPYYPIEIPANLQLYARYRRKLDGMPYIRVLGRLAAYTYINMDAAVENALALSF